MFLARECIWKCCLQNGDILLKPQSVMDQFKLTQNAVGFYVSLNLLLNL